MKLVARHLSPSSLTIHKAKKEVHAGIKIRNTRVVRTNLQLELDQAPSANRRSEFHVCGFATLVYRLRA